MRDVVLWSAINISEGKDRAAIEGLVASLRRDGVWVADWSLDPDHHRSVVSLVDSPAKLERGILTIYSWAKSHVDLRRHEGVHPRLGAVDVIPFVPLSTGATRQDAQDLAAEVARQVASEFEVPVFLYRESSLATEQRTLPELRRGGLSGLTEKMQSGALAADFGPSMPHPSLGVSVMGARPPLTAFNCLLDTRDLTLGQEIAREVRASSGGLSHLQALAFPLASLGGQVQISMNLLNPQETPPHLAYLAVQAASARRGLQVVSSELIGLVPMQALEQAFQHFLQLGSFHQSQVAENNLWNHSTEGKPHP